MNTSALARLVMMGSCMLATFAVAASDVFDADLARIQQQWAVANYQIADRSEQKLALESLSESAHQLSLKNPRRAEALIWEGIVLSTYAGVKGGVGALGLAKKSRSLFESALKLDPEALQGSAYTSLGALYSKVPGFPLSFGDHAKARELLQKAMLINPNGIDTNYFYGDFLVEQKEYAQARSYLQKALQAPARPGREVADEGRRGEISTLLARIATKSG
jgi:tetratricopeptide (TPR) repeat protein